jgi:pimeloyl-ACP methyl ester carboxylesterase
MPEGIKAGFPVFWREFGTGPQNALLLHCSLAHSRVWSRMASALGDVATMVAPDMPGHGQSANWDSRCDIHDQVTAIARDCLGSGGHVIGHSFGATVALRLAVENPERVHSLTLIEPVLFAAARDSDLQALNTYLDEEATFSRALQTEDWGTAAREFMRVWGDGRAWNMLSEKEQMGFANQMPFIRDTQSTLLDDCHHLMQSGRLEGIACPTRLIRGAQTNPVIPAIHAALARRIPHAKDLVVEGAGHMVPITHPDRVADCIRPLLTAV